MYVGHHGRSGALMALTEHGAVNARSFKRLPESDRFVASDLEKSKGLPWNLNGSLETERLDRPLVAGPDAQGIPLLPVPTGMLPPLPPKIQERRMYVTSADVRKYGGSEGCQACTQVYAWGRTNVGLPEDADVSFPQGTKRVDLESTESGIEPDARRQKIAEGSASTVRNDADSDVQVTDANTSSFEDPSSGLSSTASVCWKGEKHVRRDQVVDAFRSDCVDIDEEEAQEISSLLTEIGSVTRDCENPQKIAVSQCEKLELRPGFVVDLNALKLWNGTAWSLGNPRDGEELMNFLDREDPELVIGSSSWDVSDFLKGSSPDLHACAHAYARQHHRGKIFLHEAPIRSITWKNRDISWITSFPEVFKIKGPICRWKICKGDVNSVGYIRQAICWMTNDG